MSKCVIDQRFIIERQLGLGGAGMVFLAQDQQLERRVALKFLLPELLNDEEWMARFMREGRSLIALDHPGIVKCFAVGQVQQRCPVLPEITVGSAYLVMEFVEGKPLSRSLPDIVTCDAVTGIVRDVCEALDHAHSRGIVHRDLKCDNIILTSDGGVVHAKVIDFGLAHLLETQVPGSQKLTKTGDLVGSPYYMSPEQCMGAKPDSRSDVYALGCIIFQLLTGAPPFDADAAVGLMYLHMHEAVPIPTPRAELQGDSEKLAAIAMKCLAKKPSNRYQSASEIVQDLADSTAVPSVSRRQLVSTAKATKTVSPLITYGCLLLTLLIFSLYMSHNKSGIVGYLARVTDAATLFEIGKTFELVHMDDLAAECFQSAMSQSTNYTDEVRLRPILFRHSLKASGGDSLGSSELIISIIDNTKFGQQYKDSLITALTGNLGNYYYRISKSTKRGVLSEGDYRVLDQTCALANNCSVANLQLLENLYFLAMITGDTNLNAKLQVQSIIARATLGLNRRVPEGGRALDSAKVCELNLDEAGRARVMHNQREVLTYLGEAERLLVEDLLPRLTGDIGTNVNDRDVIICHFFASATELHRVSGVTQGIDALSSAASRLEQRARIHTDLMDPIRRNIASCYTHAGRFSESREQIDALFRRLRSDHGWLSTHPDEPGLALNELLYLDLRSNNFAELRQVIQSPENFTHISFSEQRYWGWLARSYAYLLDKASQTKNVNTSSQLSEIYLRRLKDCPKNISNEQTVVQDATAACIRALNRR